MVMLGERSLSRAIEQYLATLMSSRIIKVSTTCPVSSIPTIWNTSFMRSMPSTLILQVMRLAHKRTTCPQSGNGFIAHDLS